MFHPYRQAHTWGTTEAERAARFPIDDLVGTEGRGCYRGVTVQSTPEAIWPWLGQLRLAPYSYDWLDHGMQTSPQRLVTSLPAMAVGDPFLVWMRIVHLDPPHTVTGLCRTHRDLDGRDNWFQDLVQRPSFRAFNLDWVGVSYRLTAIGPTSTRLLVRLRWRCRDNRLHSPSEVLFLFADLLMMRRQLLNLKRLAESAPDGRLAGAGLAG